MRTDEARREWRDRFYDSLARMASEENATELLIHLGDLRESCQSILDLLDQVAAFEVGSDPRRVRTTMAHLKGELLHHMLPHLEGVKPALSSVVSDLYADAGRRGEFDPPSTTF